MIFCAVVFLSVSEVTCRFGAFDFASIGAHRLTGRPGRVRGVGEKQGNGNETRGKSEAKNDGETLKEEM